MSTTGLYKHRHPALMHIWIVLHMYTYMEVNKYFRCKLWEWIRGLCIKMLYQVSQPKFTLQDPRYKKKANKNLPQVVL